MGRKEKTEAKVLSQSLLAEGIYDLWLETDLAKDAHPGQFVGGVEFYSKLFPT